eukprot:4267146-Lingulodinium_polyedra.AAC.1
MHRRSAPDFRMHFPAAPQLVMLALTSRKGPGWRASPARLGRPSGALSPPWRAESRAHATQPRARAAPWCVPRPPRVPRPCS